MAISTLVKSRQPCKFWRICPSFKRSECDDSVIDTKDCWKYKERENKIKNESKKN